MWIHHQSVHIGTSIVACNYHSPHDHHGCSGCGLIKTRQGIVCSAIKDNICSLLVQDPSLSASSCLPIFDFFYFACVFMFVFSSFPPCIMLLNIQKPFENNSKVNSQMHYLACTWLWWYSWLDYLDSLEIRKKTPFTHSLSDNWKLVDASASKNDLRT